MVTALEQGCEITPTGLQSKPTEETTSPEPEHLALFFVHLFLFYLFSTEKLLAPEHLMFRIDVE